MCLQRIIPLLVRVEGGPAAMSLVKCNDLPFCLHVARCVRVRVFARARVSIWVCVSEKVCIGVCLGVRVLGCMIRVRSLICFCVCVCVCMRACACVCVLAFDVCLSVVCVRVFACELLRISIAHVYSYFKISCN